MASPQREDFITSENWVDSTPETCCTDFDEHLTSRIYRTMPAFGALVSIDPMEFRKMFRVCDVGQFVKRSVAEIHSDTSDNASASFEVLL